MSCSPEPPFLKGSYTLEALLACLPVLLEHLPIRLGYRSALAAPDEPDRRTLLCLHRTLLDVLIARMAAVHLRNTVMLPVHSFTHATARVLMAERFPFLNVYGLLWVQPVSTAVTAHEHGVFLSPVMSAGSRRRGFHHIGFSHLAWVRVLQLLTNRAAPRGILYPPLLLSTLMRHTCRARDRSLENRFAISLKDVAVLRTARAQITTPLRRDYSRARHA